MFATGGSSVVSNLHPVCVNKERNCGEEWGPVWHDTHTTVIAQCQCVLPQELQPEPHPGVPKKTSLVFLIFPFGNHVGPFYLFLIQTYALYAFMNESIIYREIYELYSRIYNEKFWFIQDFLAYQFFCIFRWASKCIQRTLRW